MRFANPLLADLIIRRMDGVQVFYECLESPWDRQDRLEKMRLAQEPINDETRKPTIVTYKTTLSLSLSQRQMPMSGMYQGTNRGQVNVMENAWNCSDVPCLTKYPRVYLDVTNKLYKDEPLTMPAACSVA